MKWQWTSSSFLACALLGACSGPAIAQDHPARSVPDLSRLDSKNFAFASSKGSFGAFASLPCPSAFADATWPLVGLGSYIVNAQGGCNDCHTNPPLAAGGDPFSGEPEQINAEGYLAGGTEFGLAFVSRNLTPDENGRPAGLTLQQFILVMRTGADLKELVPPPVPAPGNDLLQVMPWPVYGKMITRDLRAIYEYLRSIPSRPCFPR